MYFFISKFVLIGGDEIQAKCTEYVQRHGKLRVSEHFLTKGGNLPCSYILHAVGPFWNGGT